MCIFDKFKDVLGKMLTFSLYVDTNIGDIYLYNSQLDFVLYVHTPHKDCFAYLSTGEN